MATAPSGCGPSYADVLRGQRAQQQSGLEEPRPPVCQETRPCAVRKEEDKEKEGPKIAEKKDVAAEQIEREHVEPVTFAEIEKPAAEGAAPNFSQGAETPSKGETYAQVLLRGARRLLHPEHNKALITRSHENLERKEGLFGSQVLERKEVHRSSPMLAPRADRRYERSVSPFAKRIGRAKLAEKNGGAGKQWKSNEALRKERSVSPFTRVVYKGRLHKSNFEEKWKSTEVLSAAKSFEKVAEEVIKPERFVASASVAPEQTFDSNLDAETGAVQKLQPNPKPRKRIKKSKSEDKPTFIPAPVPPITSTVDSEPAKKLEEPAKENVGTDDSRTKSTIPVPVKRAKQKAKLKKAKSEDNASISQHQVSVSITQSEHLEESMPSEGPIPAFLLAEESAVPQEYETALRSLNIIAPQEDNGSFEASENDPSNLSKRIITHSNLYVNDERETYYSIETEVIHKTYDLASPAQPTDDIALPNVIESPQFEFNQPAEELVAPQHTLEELVTESTGNIPPEIKLRLENASVEKIAPALTADKTPALLISHCPRLSEISNESEVLNEIGQGEQYVVPENVTVAIEAELASAKSTQSKHQVQNLPEVSNSETILGQVVEISLEKVTEEFLEAKLELEAPSVETTVVADIEQTTVLSQDILAAERTTLAPTLIDSPVLETTVVSGMEQALILPVENILQKQITLDPTHVEALVLETTIVSEFEQTVNLPASNIEVEQTTIIPTNIEASVVETTIISELEQAGDLSLENTTVEKIILNPTHVEANVLETTFTSNLEQTSALNLEDKEVEKIMLSPTHVDAPVLETTFFSGLEQTLVLALENNDIEQRSVIPTHVEAPVLEIAVVSGLEQAAELTIENIDVEKSNLTPTPTEVPMLETTVISGFDESTVLPLENIEVEQINVNPTCVDAPVVETTIISKMEQTIDLPLKCSAEEQISLKPVHTEAPMLETTIVSEFEQTVVLPIENTDVQQSTVIYSQVETPIVETIIVSQLEPTVSLKSEKSSVETIAMVSTEVEQPLDAQIITQAVFTADRYEQSNSLAHQVQNNVAVRSKEDLKEMSEFRSIPSSVGLNTQIIPDSQSQKVVASESSGRSELVQETKSENIQTVRLFRSKVIPTFWLNYYLYRDAENEFACQSLPNYKPVTENEDKNESDKAPKLLESLESKSQSDNASVLMSSESSEIRGDNVKIAVENNVAPGSPQPAATPLLDGKIRWENYQLVRDAEIAYNVQKAPIAGAKDTPKIPEHKDITALVPKEPQVPQAPIVDAFWKNYSTCHDAERDLHISRSTVTHASPIAARLDLQTKEELQPSVEVINQKMTYAAKLVSSIPCKGEPSSEETTTAENATYTPSIDAIRTFEVQQDDQTQEMPWKAEFWQKQVQDLEKTVTSSEETTNNKENFVTSLASTPNVPETTAAEFSPTQKEFWESHQNLAHLGDNEDTKVESTTIELEAQGLAVEQEAILSTSDVAKISEKELSSLQLKLEKDTAPKEGEKKREEDVPFKAAFWENYSSCHDAELQASQYPASKKSEPISQPANLVSSDKIASQNNIEIVETLGKLSKLAESISTEQKKSVKIKFWENYYLCRDAELESSISKKLQSKEEQRPIESKVEPSVTLELRENAGESEKKAESVSQNTEAAKTAAARESVAKINPGVSAKTTAQRLDLFVGTFDYDLIALESAEREYEERKSGVKISHDYEQAPAEKKVEQQFQLPSAAAELDEKSKAASAPESFTDREAPATGKEKTLCNSQEIENLFDELASLVSKYEHDVKNLPKEELKLSINSLEGLLDEFMKWERRVNDVLADINSHDPEEAPEDLANLQETVLALLSSAAQGKNALLEMLAAASRKSPLEEVPVEKEIPVETETKMEETTEILEQPITQETIKQPASAIQVDEESSVTENSSEPLAVSETTSPEISIHMSADTDAEVRLQVAVVDEATRTDVNKGKSKKRKKGKKGKEDKQEADSRNEVAAVTQQGPAAISEKDILTEKELGSELAPAAELLPAETEHFQETDGQNLTKKEPETENELTPKEIQPAQNEPCKVTNEEKMLVGKEPLLVESEQTLLEGLQSILPEPCQESATAIQDTQHLGSVNLEEEEVDDIVQQAAYAVTTEPDEIVKTATKTTILTQNTQVATVTRSVFVGDKPVMEPEVSQVISHTSLVGEEERLQMEADGKTEVSVKQRIFSSISAPDQLQGNSSVVIQEITDEDNLDEGYEPTTVSSVRTLLQQTSRRIVKRVKRIIRKTVIIDGKEQEIEEIIEEPEETEVVESSVPQLSIQFTEEQLVSGQRNLDASPEQQEISTQDETVDSSLARSVSVLVSEDTEKSSVETTPRDSEEQQSSSTGAVPKAQRKKKKGRKGKEKTSGESQRTSQVSTDIMEEDTSPNTPIDLEPDKSESEQTLTVAESPEISPEVPKEESKAAAVRIKISDGSPKVELEICTNLLQEPNTAESDVQIKCSIEEEEQTSTTTSTTELEPTNQKSKRGKKGKGKMLVKSITSSVTISNGNTDKAEKPEPVIEVVQSQKSSKGKKGKQQKPKQDKAKTPPELRAVSQSDDSKSESTAYEIHVQTTVTEEAFQISRPESHVEIIDIVEEEISVPVETAPERVAQEESLSQPQIETIDLTETKQTLASKPATLEQASIAELSSVERKRTDLEKEPEEGGLNKPEQEMRKVLSAEEDTEQVQKDFVQLETEPIRTKKEPVQVKEGSVQILETKGEVSIKPTEEATLEAKTQMSNVIAKCAYKKMLPKESCARRRSSLILELPETSTEDCRSIIAENISLLELRDPSGENREIRIVTILTTVSTWLEVIEYQLHAIQELGDSADKNAALAVIKHNSDEIRTALATLHQSGLLEDDSQGILIDQIEIKKCLDSVTEHLAVVEEMTQDSESDLENFNTSWLELLACIEQAKSRYAEVESNMQAIQSIPASEELLAHIENAQRDNHALSQGCKKIIQRGRLLMKRYPQINIPLDIYEVAENSRNLGHKLGAEKDKIIQKIAITDEYKRTIDELAQIIDVAQVLVDSPLVVNDREQLQEEMQKHRKFFANLSHCQQLLESLDMKLDEESRGSHAELHKNLHSKASLILDNAACKAQRMALAASRWTFLEQGLKEENEWLKVALQRVPELDSVNSTDVQKFITQYQALAADIGAHHCRIIELTSVAQSLQELVTCGGLEATYDEQADAVGKLQDNVQQNLQKLLAFKQNWARYEDLCEKIEAWARETEGTLKNLSHQNMNNANTRQFWELKAQYEVFTLSKNEAAAQMNQAFVSLHVADEMLQRQFQGQLEDRWHVIGDKIAAIQSKLRQNLGLENSVLDKIHLMETELKDVHTSMNEITQKIQTEEDILLYIQRLQILLQRCEIMEDELSALGPASPAQLEEVSRLINSSRRLGLQLGEEKEMALTLRDKFSALVKGLAQSAHVQQLIGKKLDGCEEKEKQTSGAVEQALHDCTLIESDLALQWQKLMQLRQALHSLPLSLRASVSPVGVEREMSSLQSSHLQLEDRLKDVQSRLRGKQHEWRAFDRKLEAVQQSVQETDYMTDLLTIKGGLDYEQLKIATERLERLVGSLGPREELLSELQCAAVPLASSSAPEVRQRVEESVASAVSAWHLTSGKVRSLCSRYQDAVHLWQRYLDASDALRTWTHQHEDLPDDAEDLKALAVLAKQCEELLPEQEKDIEELLRLSEQITQLLGLEDPTSAGLALVKDVETLNKRLGNVRSAIVQLAEAAEKRALEGEVCSDDLKNTRNFLDNVQESLSVVEDLNMKDAEKQLESLRSHLLSLGKAESQIQAIREKSVEYSPAATEPENNLCIVEILQLWQQVFRETFQQYHRLSARLVRSQDGAEALRLWQEYLQHVQSFLSTSIPEDYHSLTEHQHLCEVHQNLLSSQHTLLQSKQIEATNDNSNDLDKNLAGQFSSLTNQHNETLSRIMERHAQVKSRISAWDKYRTDQTTLLAWLKDMEKERYQLQLQYVHIQLVPKVLNLIKNLLDKIPEGLSQLDNLKLQQTQLLKFSDQTLAASIQMEHAAITQRINNLQAGLETWRDFLLRVLDLHTNFEQQANVIQNKLNDVKAITCRSCPTSNTEIMTTIDTLRGQRTVLTELIPNLEELNVVHEQLKECVSPADAKKLNQRMWLLWQQHGDLDHQIALLIHHLEEKLALKNVFDARQERFLTWVEDIESRIKLTRSVYPNSLIEDTNHMEREMESEITLKEKELKWLNSTGADLLVAENDEERRLKTAEQIQQVQDAWNQMQLSRKTKSSKLSSIQQTFTQLESQITDLRTWLYNMEARLLTPLVFKSTREEDIKEKLKEAEELKKSIEKQSSNLASTLNLFEMFMVDCDSNKMLIDTNPLQLAVDSLEKRWANVCDLAEERKRKIGVVWAHLQELERLCSEQEEWLNTQESILSQIEENSKVVPKEEVQPLVGQVEDLLEQVAARNSTLQQLEQQYSKMVMESSGSFDNLCEITATMRQSLARWIRLPQIASLLLSKLRNLQQHNSQFITAHNNAVMALTNIDVKLTQLQHLKSENEPPQQTLKALQALEAELDSHNDTFENADKLGLAVMQSMEGDDFSSIQSMIDEYQGLWSSIQKRIGEFRATLQTVKDKPSKKSKKKQRTEQQQQQAIAEQKPEPLTLVNESIQVSTLEFETDQAVQVDTLPPLMRLTSKEGYQMELDSALKECADNLDALQNAIQCATPQIAEATIAANNLVRLIGLCQSSVDFVKHLSSILSEQDQSSLELEKQNEIQYLIERFNKLLSDAHNREKHFRDVSGNAKLTCPLCTNKNWQQLDNDIWRLEKWLQYAEGTQSSQKTPPSNIEQLEDVIQDNREFLLDLDSHKSIVVSLNIVGTHLADNTEDRGKAESLRARLKSMNSRWEAVCQRAANWQTQLQTTLLESREFHNTIDELNTWIKKTENCIRQTEPIDLTEDITIIENKFDKFRELKCELERCEPRVISLQEAAEQLLRHCEAPRGSNTWSRLTDLRLRLQSLRRLCGVYIVKLGAVLGRDPSEFSTIRPSHFDSTSLYNLPPLVDQAGASRLSASADELRHNGESGDEVDTTVLSRSCQFLGRVVRASLPIQALMLLLLGVAALVPSSQEDFSCTMANSFARSLEPMLRYPNGPPPI